jgi:protein-tyrosine-phosphatase
MNKKHVLILCTGNSARSQMAEGLLRHDAGDRFEVASAGAKPTSVRPEAIAVMKEVGIDISGQRSKSVEEFAQRHFDYVITVCDHAKESCPYFQAIPHSSIAISLIRRQCRVRNKNGLRHSDKRVMISGRICGLLQAQTTDSYGALASVEQVCRAAVRETDSVAPGPREQEIYARGYRTYQSLYPALQSFCHSV